jgi:DNA primase
MIDEEAGALLCNQCFKSGNGDGIAALQWLRDWDFKRAVAELGKQLGILREPPAGSKKASKPVAEYNYTDENGNILFQVVRYEPKRFSQRRPKEGGGWKSSVKGVRLVPYRLPELLAADMSKDVFIVEGEKDANRAASTGSIATTCPMGAGKWRAEYGEHFRGRRVCIVPDNDKAGRKHAEQVAELLNGVAESVRVLELPGAPDKGDLSDWLDAGGTAEKLAELARATAVWQPSLAPPTCRPDGDSSDVACPESSYELLARMPAAVRDEAADLLKSENLLGQIVTDTLAKTAC